MRVGDETREHQPQDHAALDEQPAIADGFALFQRHDVCDPFGIDGERAGTGSGSKATKTSMSR